MAQPSPTFADLPGMFARGVTTYRRVFWPGTAMAVIVLGIFGIGRATAAMSVESDQLIIALLIDFAGLTIATMAALPWFHLALAAEADTPMSLGAAWRASAGSFGAMASAGAFFWGGIFLGLRYLVGIPSVFVLIWYGLFGYAVASGQNSGLKALGTSVRLGQGRRWVMALAALGLLILNAFAAAPLSVDQSVSSVALAAPLLIATTNVSIGAGAKLYNRLVSSEVTESKK